MSLQIGIQETPEHDVRAGKPTSPRPSPHGPGRRSKIAGLCAGESMAAFNLASKAAAKAVARESRGV